MSDRSGSNAPRRTPRADLTTAQRALVEAAGAARARARAPYSGYRVGAAVLDSEGRIHLGCNIESAAYPLTLCAERVALFSAIAAGAESVQAIAVVGPGLEEQPTPPCGACRQVIWDLAPEATVLLGAPAGAVDIWRPADLLPCPFGPDHLDAGSS